MSGAPRLCIVTAVEIEFNNAAGLLSEKTFSDNSRVCRGSYGNRWITILKSGMGAVGFAEQFAAHLNPGEYDGLIVAGLAGGLDPKLHAGDAVIYDRCRDGRTAAVNVGADLCVCPGRDNPGRGRHTGLPLRSKEIEPACDEFASIVPDDRLSQFIGGALLAAGISSERGAGLTVSRVITDAPEKLSIGQRSGAAAVDMETFEIWTACANTDLPFAALRIVSDEAGQDLPDFNRAYDAAGRVNAAQMVAVMLSRPAAAARFLANLRPVMRSFRRALKAVLDAQLP